LEEHKARVEKRIDKIAEILDRVASGDLSVEDEVISGELRKGSRNLEDPLVS